MTVPGYTDISHIRAPYKNSYVYTGVGADEAPPVATPATAMATATEVKDGVLYWKPDVADIVITGLKGYTAVYLSDRAVQLVPLTPEQAAAISQGNDLAVALSAAAWLQRKLKEGNVVFATPGVLFPVAGLTQQLAAVPKGDKEMVRMTSNIAPVLATPSMLAALMTPAAMAGALIVGGIAAWAIYAGFKRRGGASSAV